MNTYKIDLKFIWNQESFVMAVLGCIYEELKIRIKGDKSGCLDWIDEARRTVDDIGRCYSIIFKYKHDPIEQFNRMDMLEVIENATFLIKLQEKVDKLSELFEGKPIVIEVINGNPYSSILPDLSNLIIFEIPSIER